MEFCICLKKYMKNRENNKPSHKSINIMIILVVMGNSMSSYHKWSLTICDGCFDTLKSSKMWS